MRKTISIFLIMVFFVSVLTSAGLIENEKKQKIYYMNKEKDVKGNNGEYNLLDIADNEEIDSNIIKNNITGPSQYSLLFIRTLGWNHVGYEGTEAKLLGGTPLFMPLDLVLFVGFCWGTSYELLPTAYDHQASAAFDVPYIFESIISNLNRTKTYHFRATGFFLAPLPLPYWGIDMTCKPGLPIAWTINATNITYYSANLHGEVKNMAGAQNCQVWFRYGTNSSNLTSKTEGYNKTSRDKFSERVTDLESNTTYYYRAYVSTDVGTDSGATLNFTTLVKSNPPEAPSIEGPNKALLWLKYRYTFSTIDPDGDIVYFYIDWGDGTIENWVGPYDSGEKVKIKHRWEQKQQNHTIKSKAKDFFGTESDWGFLMISTPENKSNILNPLFQRFREILLGRFPGFILS